MTRARRRPARSTTRLERARPWVRGAGLAAGVILTAVATTHGPAAQQSFARGQSVVPAYEGWERNEDGSFTLVFGYLNRNWEQRLHLPVGVGNAIEPGGPDRGQPTYFLPRRNRFVFRIRVPPDFGDREVVWTLVSNGRTERAYGTLKPDYFIDDGVLQANVGAGGAAGTTPELPGNTPPVLTVDGAPRRTVAVGAPLRLAAHVTDDGIPRARSLPPARPGSPGPITTDSATGLRFSWFVYRGDGEAARFTPPQLAVWEDTRPGRVSPWSPGFSTPAPPPDGRWVATATFERPGAYVVRGIAHDGGLAAVADVVVSVRPE